VLRSQVRPREGESETKLLVRNLAFEASAQDVRAVMEAFGRVKTCRLPRKFDGARRGFAFVEYGTPGEAQRAVAQAHGMHLYGRRLLLEYAQAEEGLDELRAKASAQLAGGGVGGAASHRNKRAKIR
jgi:multiple RNA-binding domain-containing protein 1